MPIKRPSKKGSKGKDDKKGKKDAAHPSPPANGKAAKARRPKMGAVQTPTQPKTPAKPPTTEGENLFMRSIVDKKNGNGAAINSATAKPIIPIKRAIKRETAETMALKQKDIAV